MIGIGVCDPHALREVVTLPTHRPFELLKASAPTEDGLLGFDNGGVARVRLYELPERTVILFSTLPTALWGPSPYGSVHGQLTAMQAIWDHVLLGRHRHPLDVEWWAHPGGRGRTWYDAAADVIVTLDGSGWYKFAPRLAAADEPFGSQRPAAVPRMRQNL